MGSDQAGRLLLYAYSQTWQDGMIPPSDLIKLTASMQRQFPDQVVEPAGLEWLREVVGDSVPLPPPVKTPEQLLDELVDGIERERLDRAIVRDPLASADCSPLELLRPEYVYVVLAWLAGMVSKQAAEHAVEATADVVRGWMRERRDKKLRSEQVALIYGPDGEVLKEVRMRPEASARQRPRRRSP